MEPTPEQILDAAKASGYLMEQEVATTLGGLGFGVQTNRPFKDPDEGKSRELDVHAWKTTDVGQLSVSLELACECKNNQNPLVFLTRKMADHDRVISPYHVFFPRDVYERDWTSPEGQPGYQQLAGFRFFDLAADHYWFSSDEKAVQFFKVVRENKGWKANHDGIHDSLLLPLAKAIVARRAELGDIARFSNDVVVVVVPMVVTACEQHVIATDSGDLTPRRVGHVTLARSLRSATVEGTFLFEFVSKSHLAGVINEKILPFAALLPDRLKGCKLRGRRPR